MTVFAAASSVEICLSSIRIAGQQLLDGILPWDSRRSQGFLRARVQIRSDVEHLRIGQRHCRHAFIRAPKTNDFANLVALHVMRHKRRANQVGSPSTRGVGSMAESAGLLELLVS